MKVRYRYPILVVAALAAVLGATFAQIGTYTPGVFQSTNPNYPIPNPFYFEGKIDWNLLGITQPQNAWDFLQRGMHFQDDLDDIPSAINDYQTSLSMNSLQMQTCQIVTAQSNALTGDLANNWKVHWELAQVYVVMGQNILAKAELQSYLQATQWHSDVYPWRIALARSQIQTLVQVK